MTEDDYHRYIEAFNARDYAAMEAYFADDFVLENGGFKVVGKQAFREFYAFFHEYFREQVTFKEYFPGQQGSVANVLIRFTGERELTQAMLDEKGFSGMTPVPVGVDVELEFYIHYLLDEDGLIRHIKGAVWIPAQDAD